MLTKEYSFLISPSPVNNDGYSSYEEATYLCAVASINILYSLSRHLDRESVLVGTIATLQEYTE